MQRLFRSSFFAALLLTLGASAALAQSPSPVGQWRTIDDETGEPRSIVEIFEENGVLKGRVVEILRASSKAQRNADGQIVCSACDGKRADQPIEGMTILWGLQKDGDEWTGGNILDPSNGNTYKAKMSLDGKNRLDVRGYRGMALFGRTQTWHRVPSSS